MGKIVSVWFALYPESFVDGWLFPYVFVVDNDSLMVMKKKNGLSVKSMILERKISKPTTGKLLGLTTSMDEKFYNAFKLDIEQIQKMNNVLVKNSITRETIPDIATLVAKVLQSHS